jgi:sulfiredoxin
MLKAKAVRIENVYVPTKRRATLEPSKVEELAENIMNRGQTTPILVREDGERFVLVEGLHRLEACKALGEKTILAFLVQARRH